jgi:hypothetical protein
MTTKYELVKKTEISGDVWYHITKDGEHVNETYTRELEEAEKLFGKIVDGYLIEPKIEILKTLKIQDKDENKTN